MKRFYTELILSHCKKYRQMLFLMGPRKAGKITVCQSIAKIYPDTYYYSWDNEEHKELILSGIQKFAHHCKITQQTENTPIVILDEIHKYKDWKNFLKGLYDTYPKKAHLIITGSARLDVYQKSGDSLMGRYLYYRFYPLSIAEVIYEDNIPEIFRKPKQISEESFSNLLNFGPFPDPFFEADEQFYLRWKNLRNQQLFKEDVRDITKVQELDGIAILAKMIQNQSGQLINYSALSKKIRVSDHTIKNWLSILTNLYYCFSIKPYSQNISKSLIKGPKYYLLDWSLCQDKGALAENFIASHLIKAINFYNDHGLEEFELFFIRTKDQREVDFLITMNQAPWILIEVKNSIKEPLSKNLIYFKKQLNPKYSLQVALDGEYIDAYCFNDPEPIIVSAKTFLSQLV